MSEYLKNIKKIFQQKFSDQLPLISMEEYRYSAVLLLLMQIQDQEHILFQVRSQKVPQPNEISLPGGMVEKTDIDSRSTALRECCEELGVSEGDIEILGGAGTLVTPTANVIDLYVASTSISDILAFSPNSDEVDHLFAVPLDFFRETEPKIYQAQSQIDALQNACSIGCIAENDLSCRYRKPWGRRTYHILFYQWKNYCIWGITAKLIHYYLKNFDDRVL